VPAARAVTILRSLPHGHVAAVHAMAVKLGLPALRAPAIRKLMADDGPLQLSLFDQQDLAEITSGDFPGERLIACRNPVLAADRARTREELLAVTEKLLAPLIARVQAGRLRAPDRSGSRSAR
jgi:hypothetical protein